MPDHYTNVIYLHHFQQRQILIEQTRRTLNADGTIALTSFSYWGSGDAAEALRQELAELEKRNSQARAEWYSLTPEERERRTSEFKAQEKARDEAIKENMKIPPHVLAKLNEQESQNPGAVFT